jgi:hypothetical protein
MEKLPQTVHVFDKLLSLEKIERHHLEALSPEEKTAFMEMVYTKLESLGEVPRNELIEKTIALLDNDFVWQHNHAKIMDVINGQLRVDGTVPGNAYLAAKCGLSRKTVREHLRNFSISETWDEEKQALHMLKHNVMGAMAKAAVKGNVKAAKLYLDNINETPSGETTINNQNNHIQINKTVINQQIIQQLKPEQLQQIEQIIAGNESKPQ